MWKYWTGWLPQFVIVLASIAAAVFWFWSSAVGISNNQDTFIADIQWASQLSAYAALAAGVAAFVGAFKFFWEWGVTKLIWDWFSTRFD